MRFYLSCVTISLFLQDCLVIQLALEALNSPALGLQYHEQPDLFDATTLGMTEPSGPRFVLRGKNMFGHLAWQI